MKAEYRATENISITLVAESHDDAEAKALSLAENNELVGQNEYTMSGFEICYCNDDVDYEVENVELV